MADNFWDGALGVLGKVAPMLASAIGGPLAGAATSAIISALGLPADTTPTQAAAVVAGATPDQLLQLQKADEDFRVKMEQLRLDTTKLAFDDVASARNRETIVKDSTPAIMGYILVLGSLGAAGAVLAGLVPDTSLQAGVVLGYLFSEAKQVLSYYFGSSLGSANKDDTTRAGQTALANSTPIK
jgi:hypothetical protein